MWSVPTGERIDGRFEVVRPLGRGAHGQLFVAIQHPLGRQVAVKLLRNPGLAPQAEEAFRREAAALARLTHPCCVQVIDYGVWNDQLYLVMELVQGRPLRALMLGRPLPIGRAVSIGLQIARGLAHAHREGIVHRDLSPANVMVLDDEVDGIGVKLVDFGLARMEASDDAASETPILDGTPSYIAPERIRGEHGDARGDVYAAGLILFEMLTGAHPFRRDSPDQTLAAHLNEPVPTLAELIPGAPIPAALEFVVTAATSRDPAHRPADGGQLRKLMIAALLATTEGGAAGELPSLEHGLAHVPPALREPATAPSGISWAYRTMEPGPALDPPSHRLSASAASLQETQETQAMTRSLGIRSRTGLAVLGVSLLATSFIALSLLMLRLVLG